MSKLTKNQLQSTFEALQGKPKTMLEVARLLNIERANVCRYVSRLRKLSKIAVTKKDRCSITRHRAGYLTSDPKKFPPLIQLDIFE